MSARETSPEPPPSPEIPRSKNRHLVGLGLFAGLVLMAIGVRFIVDPKAAQHTFGLAKGLLGRELHSVIGLRDLWLGALAVLFAALKEWRALTLWLALGAVVCIADAGIVAASSGKWWAIAFHLGSAVFCGWLAVACWRAARRQDEGSEGTEEGSAPPA